MRLHTFAYCSLFAALAACGSVDRPFGDDAGDDTPIDSSTAPDAIPQFTVTISPTGNGSGRITSNPTGIDCGGTCSGEFDSGQSITLTAAPDADSTFVGWTGGTCTGTGTCTFDVDADVTIQAAFALNNSVVVTIDGTGSGTVISDVAGIDCPGDCDEAYGPGQTVVLTATAIGDSFFEGWTGGGCGGTGTCTVNTDTAVGVTATFTLNQYTLTVNPGGNGAGSITSNPPGIDCPSSACSAAFDSGTNVVLTATPSAGRFAGWSNGPCGGTSTCSIDITTDVNVDATFSLIQVIDVSSSTVNGIYTTPTSILIQATFTDPVAVTGTPTITLNSGGTASYSAGSGTSTLTFTYTVSSGQNTADLDYGSVNALSLNGGTIKDIVGNNATLTLPTPGAVGSLGANKNIVVDTLAPTVSSVNSTTVNGSYGIGSGISIQVAFSEAVTVTGTPTLTLNSGATVNYASGTGSSTLTFTYTVASGNSSSDLDYSTVNSLALAGGTIRDAATNNATLTLPTPGAANSLGANKNLVVDGVAPTVSGVNSTTVNGTYNSGTISIQVTFSEAVNVSGTPLLALNTGVNASYASGTGTTTLNFNYTIAAGQNSADLDYAAATSLSLNGGTIRDAILNNATLTLPTPGAAGSLGANKNIVVDSALPTVTGVTSSTPDGSFPAGTVIPILVNFSEAVNVTGTPLLAVNTGVVVRYTSGSGTSTLTFTYTVSPRQFVADLDYNAAGSLTLNGGTIRDAATNNATLTLPNPGSTSSLGGNKNIAISAIFVADSIPALQTFTNSQLSNIPCGIAWDGANLWVCSAGVAAGNTMASYTNAYAFQSFYTPTLDFRSFFTKTDGVGPVYAKVLGSNIVRRQTSPGVFTNDVTLAGGNPEAQANMHFDTLNNEFISMNNGVIDRWNGTNGAYIGAVTLQGWGQNGENSGTQNRGIVWAGGFYLTYSNGILSAWNQAGVRVDTTTLAGASTSQYYSFTYARGMVWMSDGPASAWRGYNVGLEPTRYDAGWSVAGVTYTNNSRSVSGNSPGSKNTRTLAGRSTGKFYWEVTATAGDGSTNAGGLGILESAMPNNSLYIGFENSGLAWGYGSCCIQYYFTWPGVATPSGQPPANSNPAPGLVYMFALDMTSGRFWAGQNGTWYNGGDPATGANPAATGLTGTVFQGESLYASSIDAFTANFGNATFSFPPPTGFIAGLY